MSGSLSTGYRGNAAWRDMSEFAVHFTKPLENRTSYDSMMGILSEGFIRPGGPFGAARRISQIAESQKSACFSEIPLDLLDRLITRRQSLYGIGFRQDILVAHGGARVWYLDAGGAAAAAFRDTVKAAEARRHQPDDPIWRLTPFVDFPGTYGQTQYRFEWEREWRVPGGLRFAPGDVAFLFIPEELHGAALAFFEDAQREHTGPAYFCPYIDPRWDMPRIQTAFSAVALPPPAPVALPSIASDGVCDYCGGPTVGGECIVCGNITM